MLEFIYVYRQEFYEKTNTTIIKDCALERARSMLADVSSCTSYMKQWSDSNDQVWWSWGCSG